MDSFLPIFLPLLEEKKGISVPPFLFSCTPFQPTSGFPPFCFSFPRKWKGLFSLLSPFSSLAWCFRRRGVSVPFFLFLPLRNDDEFLFSPPSPGCSSCPSSDTINSGGLTLPPPLWVGTILLPSFSFFFLSSSCSSYGLPLLPGGAAKRSVSSPLFSSLSIRENRISPSPFFSFFRACDPVFFFFSVSH